MGRLILATLLLFGAASVAFGQQARPAMLAIDTSAAVDETVDADGNTATGIIVDSLISVDVGHGFQGIARPFAQRIASTHEWNRQIWVATLRYEHRGAVSVRADGGYIAPPIGLANLTLRPHMNPTIAQPSSLFQPLPPLEPRGPRATLLGAIYPLGAIVTVSTSRWDARGGVIDSSPLRARRVFAQQNPPRFTNVVVGGGITPFIGLRIGGSVTRGGWLKAGESPAATIDRTATVATLESEFSFLYTKLSGEWVRDTVDTSSGSLVASGWFMQGQQTLTPRWFVAARLERISSALSPSLVAPISGVLPGDHARFNGVEETVGYRLTRDVTLRASHRARRGFGRPDFDHTAAVSFVFFRRWI